MMLYHAVASERGEDGTQIIDLGIFSTEQDAKNYIDKILVESQRDFGSNILTEENRCWEGEPGNETYEWVADIIPLQIEVKSFQ